VLEKRGVSPDVAIRLAKYFGTSPDLWLGLQRDVDLWDALEANRKAYDRIKPRKGKAAYTRSSSK
jgi:plasmid maintenance system antidote protein VapI